MTTDTAEIAALQPAVSLVDIATYLPGEPIGAGLLRAVRRDPMIYGRT